MQQIGLANIVVVCSELSYQLILHFSPKTWTLLDSETPVRRADCCA